MAELHAHVATPPPTGWVRVDLHCHSMWSGDATTTPEELAEAVAVARIDVLCVTDHNTIEGAVALAGRLPCRVVVGEELRTGWGEVIGLFLTEHLPRGLSPLAAAERIRAQGGVVYVPHPFDPTRPHLQRPALDELVGLGLVDAVEVFNAKTPDPGANDEARNYAEEHGLLAGAGSDAHVPAALGAAYVEVPDFDGPASFLEALADARVVGHHFDAPRAWRSRIVPSLRTS